MEPATDLPPSPTPPEKEPVECQIQPQAITPEQLTEALSRIVTPLTIGSLTRRITREKLEDEFGLPREALADRKLEINQLLRTQMDALAKGEIEVAKPAAVKRQRASSDAASSDKQSEDGSSEEEEEAVGSKAEAKSKAAPSARKAQSAIMTRSYFTDHAEAMPCKLGPAEFVAQPREFGTGSCGWFYGSKQEFMVAGKPLMCQLTLNCTVLGSKTWKSGAKKKARKTV